MALYLNNAQYGSSNQSSQDTLIHSYNKSFFSDYNQAKSVLLQKVMKPGEVTFAYYYDPKTPYGQNTIFAVGPLSAAGCNTIFKNADEIDSVKDVLDETIADINASVSNMETKVDGIIEECRNPLLTKIENNSKDIVSIKRDISIIKSDIVNTNDTLTSKINQVNNQLIAQMSQDKTILINKINDKKIDCDDKELKKKLKKKNKFYKKIVLLIVIFINIGILVYLKYSNFLVHSVNSLFNLNV